MIIAAFATGCEERLFVHPWRIFSRRAEDGTCYSRVPFSRIAWQKHSGSRRNLRHRSPHRAGAYICGEETALLNSIEGYRGEPRNKPPFPTQLGLFGQPTVINNVETLINVPSIVLDGGDAFASVGSGQSTGTKLFCLSGHVMYPGVYEAKFGVTLRQLLDLAGGISGTGRLKGVLIGGAAGAFVGQRDLEMPLTFEGARAAGTSLGSAVVMPFDDTVDLQPDPPSYRGVLSGRILRAVRPLSSRHGTTRRAASSPGSKEANRFTCDRIGRAQGSGTGHARCVDLRARTDGV